MAAPVITSRLTLDAVVDRSVFYQIRATNFPTSYTVLLLPPQMQYSPTTGRIGGKVRAVGIYSVTIQATNSDGTGSATLVVTATDGGILPPPNETGITVFQSKFWARGDERFDYADADDAGHPIAEFDSDSIGSPQLSATAISKKVTAIGGAGRIGQLVLPADIILAIQVRFSQKIGVVSMPGVASGDPVVTDELVLSNDTVPAVNNCVFFGVAGPNAVSIYCFNGTGNTLLKDSRINFRVFSFTNG